MGCGNVSLRGGLTLVLMPSVTVPQHPDANRSALEHVTANEVDKLREYIKNRTHPKKPQKQMETGFTSFLNGYEHLIGLILADLKAVDNTDVLKMSLGIVKAVLDHAASASKEFTKFFGDGKVNWGAIDEETGKAMVQAFLGDALNIRLSPGAGNAGPSIVALHKLATFLIKFPLIMAGVGFVGKAIFKHRWDSIGGATLGRMGEEMGISWLMGTLLEEVFTMAYMRPIEENINYHKRPNRLEWRELRLLLRQHQINQGEFDKRLRLLGFPEDIVGLLSKLDEQQLAASDIFAAKYNGTPVTHGYKGYLQHLGYSDDDIDILWANYVDHNETGAKEAYRSSLRHAYRQRVITKSEFTDGLTKIGEPEASAKLEAEAIDLEHKSGIHTLSVGEVKSLHRRNIMDDAAARTQLDLLGYASHHIDQLIKEWNEDNASHTKHIPASKILTYKYHNVIDAGTATRWLVAQGYKEADASFMVDHPTTKGGSTQAQEPATLIIAAMRDGFFPPVTAQQKLVALGETVTEANDRIRVAQYSEKRHIKPRADPIPLSSGQVHAVLKSGIMPPSWAIDTLESLGYSYEDASLLVDAWANLPYGAGDYPGQQPPPITNPPTFFHPSTA